MITLLVISPAFIKDFRYKINFPLRLNKSTNLFGDLFKVPTTTYLL